MRRETLIDFFRDAVQTRGEFLVYDDGYRRQGHSYEAVGRAARGFAARLRAVGLQKGDKALVRDPSWGLSIVIVNASLPGWSAEMRTAITLSG